MQHHQKVIVCTNSNGKGKAIYYENDNGKVTKKEKPINSLAELEKVHADLGFEATDADEFFDFSVPSPFGILDGFLSNLFAQPALASGEQTEEDEENQNLMPEGIDINKHRTRLQEIKKKKQETEAARQQNEKARKYLLAQKKELEKIKRELQAEGDTEGVADVEADIQKIETALES